MVRTLLAISLFLLTTIEHAQAESVCALAPPPTVSSGRDVANSAVVGVAVGGALGAIIGNNTGNGKAKKEAVLGGVAGGALGALVGKKAAKDRKEYLHQSEYLNCEIAYTEGEIKNRQSRIEKAEVKSGEARTQVKRLSELYKTNSIRKRDLRAIKVSLKGQLRTVNNELELVNSEIKRLKDINTNAVARAREDEKALKRNKLVMTTMITELENQYTDFIGVRDDLLLASKELKDIG